MGLSTNELISCAKQMIMLGEIVCICLACFHREVRCNVQRQDGKMMTPENACSWFTGVTVNEWTQQINGLGLRTTHKFACICQGL